MESMAAPKYIGTTSIESLPEVDTLSAYDFWHVHRSTSLQQPELVLMMAVLEDALKCYFDNARATSRRGSQLFEEAERWFFSSNDEYLFSFENICGFLRIEPNQIRRRLLMFKRSAAIRQGMRKKISSKPPTQDNHHSRCKSQG